MNNRPYKSVCYPKTPKFYEHVEYEYELQRREVHRAQAHDYKKQRPYREMNVDLYAELDQLGLDFETCVILAHRYGTDKANTRKRT